MGVWEYELGLWTLDLCLSSWFAGHTVTLFVSHDNPILRNRSDGQRQGTGTSSGVQGSEVKVKAQGLVLAQGPGSRSRLPRLPKHKSPISSDYLL